ncbi:PH domain-containing protein DDB_G0287875 [Drosophila santomea]|uniref:PH domain-containing protein DDB_G0287875 n=1 Tax=Drosophila santomea TaxID=129105 RepID=UPI00195415BB|nr:PH domain-containing protein DDB_G0287875 [Drosophila santomea]
MIGVLMRFLWSLAMVQCIQARVSMLPRFYGQDSAIIVDINRKFPPRMDSKLQNALYYNLPVYKLIKPTTTTTSTTTAAPTSGYPADLLDLAHNKLGLKELPSLEDLGEMIGTNGASETIDYIRTLTGTEEGLALMKQYLDALHFEEAEENVAEEQEKAENDDDDDDDDDNTMGNASYDEIPQERATAPADPSPKLSLMQRFGDFMKQYNLWSGQVSTTTTPAPFIAAPTASFQPVFVPPPPAGMTPLRPILVRQPLPYHYPIPLRPVSLASPKSIQLPTTTTTTTTTPAPVTKPHLNTPKLIMQEDAEGKYSTLPPHIQQLAKMANISPQVVEIFLERQPKLAELAKRLSTLALSPEQTQAMDAQVLKAVQHALSSNDDLQRLIEAAQALK